jgi:hypothetical protein
MAPDHNDIYTIVERLRVLEEGLTPTTVKHGLNAQQKTANQLGATFRPKTVAVLTARTDPKNPMAGKLVGGCEESEELEEAVTSEDRLEKAAKSFTDYLKSVADEIRQDTDLKDKKHEDTDIKAKDTQDRTLVAKQKQVADEDSELDSALSGTIPAAQPAGEPGVSMRETAAVRTVANESGLWEMHGNDQAGFEIRRAGRCLPTRFNTLDEAELALEMFNARRRGAAPDYIDEA